MKRPKSFRGKREQKVSILEKEQSHLIPASGMLYAFQTISLFHRAAHCTPIIGVWCTELNVFSLFHRTSYDSTLLMLCTTRDTYKPPRRPSSS